MWIDVTYVTDFYELEKNHLFSSVLDHKNLVWEILLSNGRNK